MRIPREHLTVVLNQLWRADVETIPVTHPCDEIGELLRIELGDADQSTVRITAGANTYEARREEVHREYGKEAYEDLPDAAAYIRALAAGGLVPVDNADEIQTFLDRHGYPDLEAGHHPVFAGIDANTFPWRLPSTLGFDPELPRYDDRRPPINGYALSSGVKEELDWYYKQYHTRQLTEAFGDEFSRLDEQPAGSNREGFLGLYEYRRLRANRRTDIVESGTGDASIIEGYADYASTSRRDVLLFSNDYGFVERATENGLKAQHVTYPVGTPRSVSASWDTIRNTLYVLAIVFGVLILPKVTLYGVWNGKSGRDWQFETIDVDCRSPTLEDVLERDLSVIEAYE